MEIGVVPEAVVPNPDSGRVHVFLQEPRALRFAQLVLDAVEYLRLHTLKESGPIFISSW